MNSRSARSTAITHHSPRNQLVVDAEEARRWVRLSKRRLRSKIRSGQDQYSTAGNPAVPFGKHSGHLKLEIASRSSMRLMYLESMLQKITMIVTSHAFQSPRTK